MKQPFKNTPSYALQGNPKDNNSNWYEMFWVRSVKVVNENEANSGENGCSPAASSESGPKWNKNYVGN